MILFGGMNGAFNTPALWNANNLLLDPMEVKLVGQNLDLYTQFPILLGVMIWRLEWMEFILTMECAM